MCHDPVSISIFIFISLSLSLSLSVLSPSCIVVSLLLFTSVYFARSSNFFFSFSFIHSQASFGQVQGSGACNSLITCSSSASFSLRVEEIAVAFFSFLQSSLGISTNFLRFSLSFLSHNFTVIFPSPFIAFCCFLSCGW